MAVPASADRARCAARCWGWPRSASPSKPGACIASPAAAAPSMPRGRRSAAPSAACGWPTTVLVEGGGGLCTGTLVHPQVVITAAHCSGNNEAKQIGFGPNGSSRSRSATCHPHPNYNGNATNDITYCMLSQAVEPLEPSSPKVLRNLLIATFLGTLLGVGLAFALEFYDPRVRSETELTESLALPLLGVIQSSSWAKGRRRRWPFSTGWSCARPRCSRFSTTSR